MADTVCTERKDLPRRVSFRLRLWLIPVAACVVNLLTMGSERSSSLIFSELIETEHYSRLVTSLQFSARGAAAILLSPVVGYLGTRMSYGTLSSCGLFMYVVGRGICYFSTNIIVITIFNGFVIGGAMLITTLLIPPTMNMIFKERRSSAMGIATLGGGLGGFLWPHLTQFFIENYGLRGSFLLSAGVSLHGFYGILYISSYLNTVNEKRTGPNGDRNKSKSKERELECLHSAKSDFKPKTESPSSEEETHFNRPMLSSEKVCQQENIEGRITAGRNSETIPVEDLNQEAEHPRSHLQILGRIFTTRAFYMLCFTNIATTFSQAALNQLVVDYMSDKGLNRQSALLIINAFALGGILGRLCFGWIVDAGFISAPLQKALTLTIFASTLILTIFLDNFYILWTCYCLLGICQASILVTNWVQYATYFDSKEMIVAMSTNRFFRGFVQLARGPLTGFIRDVCHTYDYFFIAVGVLLYIVSAMWMYEEIFSKKDKHYKRLSTEDPDMT